MLLFSLASPELRVPGEKEIRRKLIMCRDPKPRTASKDQIRERGGNWRLKGKQKTRTLRRKSNQTDRPP